MEDFVVGCFGGCAGVLAGHPFDVIKVRLQTLQRLPHENGIGVHYKNGRDAFRAIIKLESYRALLKGITSPLAAQGAINAVIFGTQHNLMKILPPSSLSSEALAGFVTGAVQTLVCCPMELSRIRMSNSGVNVSSAEFAKNRPHKNPYDVLRKLFRSEGVRGVYRGFIPTVIRDAPAFCVYFVSYEFLCRWFSGWEMDRTKRHPGVIFMAGGLAGMLSWALVYPPDLVKTLMQDEVTCQQYKNWRECTKHVWRTQGYRGFFPGYTVAVLRSFPANAATFLTVEYGLRLYHGLIKKD